MQVEESLLTYRWYNDPLCTGAQAAFLSNSLLLQLFVLPDFFSCYFNDLLLIPAALPPVLALQHSLGTRRVEVAHPSTGDVLWHLALWSLLFEWVGPRFLHTGTSDIMDIIAYAVGGIVSLFFWYEHRESNERTSKEKIPRSTCCSAGSEPATTN